MAAFEKDKGNSLYSKLTDLYVKYGFYKEHLVSITKKGMDGQQQIADMMEKFRNDPPTQLNGVAVTELLDYEKKESRNLITGTVTPINLPKSNVLQFVLEDGSKISARPSGTEPKIKFYFSVRSKLNDKTQVDTVSAELDLRIKKIIQDLKL
jgi:phosphoglucomutase